jgi:hypothetical protein
MINGADDERADQIFDRLEAHITICPLATLPSRERRTLPWERVDDIRAVIANSRVAGKLRLH